MNKTSNKLKTKLLGKILCFLFGHPVGGNVWIQGINTYCPRCGKKNLP